MGNEICCSNSTNKLEQEEINSVQPQKNIITNQKSLENKCPISLKINFDKNRLIEHKEELEEIDNSIDIIPNEQNTYNIIDNNIAHNNIDLKYTFRNNFFGSTNQNINNGNLYEKKESFNDDFILKNPFQDRDTLSTQNNFQFMNSLNLKNHYFDNIINFSKVSTIKTNKLSENEKNNNQSLPNKNSFNKGIMPKKKVSSQQNENNEININNNDINKSNHNINNVIRKEEISQIEINNFNVGQISFNEKSSNNIFSINNYQSDRNLNNNIKKNIANNMPKNENAAKNDNNNNNQNDLIVNNKYIKQNRDMIHNINQSISNEKKLINLNDKNLIANNDINKEKDMNTNDSALIQSNLMQKDNEIIQNKNIIQNNNIYSYTNNYIIQNSLNDNKKAQEHLNRKKKNLKSKEKPDSELTFSKKEIEYIFKEGEKKLLILNGKNPTSQTETQTDLLTESDNEFKRLYQSKISAESEESSTPLDKSEFSKTTISVREIQPLKIETIEEKPQFRKEILTQEKIVTKQNKEIEKTIVKKPIVYTTVSPKKYIKTSTPEKIQLVESAPKYSETIQSPTKVEFNINKNINVITKEDINRLFNNCANNNEIDNIKNDVNIKDNNDNSDYTNINEYYNNDNNNNYIDNENNNNDKKDNNDNNNNYIDNENNNNDNKDNNDNINNNSIYTFKNDKNVDASIRNLNNEEEEEEKKIIIESIDNNKYEPINDINNTFDPILKYNSPIKSNILKHPINISVKTSKSYIVYDDTNNLYDENIEMSPLSETRNLNDKQISIKKSLTQYNNYNNFTPTELNESNINQTSNIYKQSHKPRQATLFEQYNRHNPEQKVYKLNLNNENNITNIKKSKSFDISTKKQNINNSFNDNHFVNEYNNGITSTQPDLNSILNIDYLKNKQISNMNFNYYEINSMKSNYSLESHRSNISNSPKNNMNNSPYLYKNNEKYSEQNFRSNRFIENNSQVFPRYESPIGSNKNIINNSINNNISNNSLYQPNIITNMSIISPNNIELSNENRQIVNYYLNINSNNISTFSPNAFKLFYPTNEEHFIVPENEISGQKEIINYINNNPNLQEKYIGTVNHFNQMHGFGKLISPNSQKIGTWRNGEFCGWGREIKNNGEVYEGKFKNGKISGKGIYKYKDVIYIGDFDNNIRQGKGEKITKHYYYKGEFNKDKIDGYGKIQFMNSKEGKMEYEGFFKDNKIEGSGIIKWSNGNVYEGYVKNGKMNGYGRFIPKNGVAYKGFFVDGIRIESQDFNNSRIYNNKNNNY